jgi:hypothetical protein
MFDMNNCKVFVLDPLHSTERADLHEVFYKIIGSSLSRCISRFFNGWTINPIEQWSFYYPKLIHVPIARYFHYHLSCYPNYSIQYHNISNAFSY